MVQYMKSLYNVSIKQKKIDQFSKLKTAEFMVGISPIAEAKISITVGN